ncbi:DHH family phosphoesterase [Thalassotalea sp. LPB0316]|uniref:DHH family phosphoesterase n=1 Tax=Thalassotalea sp. LPB0316 TaxID=2769490 RepID=UPI0018685CAB|nr:DHH family phosphoesterase [Thalassotalea sp. LPB0316]QOL24430.1 DHH family phosphoesterase [Thalassotalea sp. LPB0316]
MHFDVFNGDADGILALVQLRLAQPMHSELITGVKRDISLVKRVDIDTATSVTVLDVSMEKNIEGLNALLAKGISVDYIDHHRPGDIPQAENLSVTIDIDPNTCTSLLVNERLNEQYVYWAIAAAYGDNMTASADTLVAKHGLSSKQAEQLKSFGIYINYNGYGRDVEDLHFAPDQLFKLLVQFDNPFDLINQPDSVYHQLAKAYQEDMAKAKASPVLFDSDILSVVELIDEPWSRRVSGVYGNELANQAPHKAHAVFTLNADDTYTVSLRAPLNNKQGAGDICAQFETGGGRAAAAGINNLPKDQLGKFIDVVAEYYR